MIKYCVYLTYYKGNLLPKWYIGSSSDLKIKNGYNGSIKSKKFKDIYKSEQTNNKHLFKTRILSYHCTRKEALVEELRLQQLHKVVKNKLYMNESYATINGFFGRDVKGINHPQYGKPSHNKGKKLQSLSSERKEHLSKMLKGASSINRGKRAAYDENGNKYMCHSDDERILLLNLSFKPEKIKRTKEEINELISKALTGRKMKEEVKIKISESTKGIKKNSEETRIKISESLKMKDRNKINIYDENDNLIYTSTKSFVEFCKINKLPHSSFKKSFLENGSPILTTNQSISQIKDSYFLKFKNWYAKKV